MPSAMPSSAFHPTLLPGFVPPIQAYVDHWGNITTPEMVVQALLSIVSNPPATPWWPWWSSTPSARPRSPAFVTESGAIRHVRSMVLDKVCCVAHRGGSLAFTSASGKPLLLMMDAEHRPWTPHGPCRSDPACIQVGCTARGHCVSRSSDHALHRIHQVHRMFFFLSTVIRSAYGCVFAAQNGYGLRRWSEVVYATWSGSTSPGVQVHGMLPIRGLTK